MECFEYQNHTKRYEAISDVEMKFINIKMNDYEAFILDKDQFSILGVDIEIIKINEDINVSIHFIYSIRNNYIEGIIKYHSQYSESNLI